MDPVKLEHFRAESGKDFPPYASLSVEAATAVRERLAITLGLPENTPGAALARRLRSSSSLASDRRVDSDERPLGRVVSQLAPGLEGAVLLNWVHWDEVDRMACRDAIDHFEDVWYPKADDIDILDESFRWIVSVDHDGWIYSTLLPPKDAPIRGSE